MFALAFHRLAEESGNYAEYLRDSTSENYEEFFSYCPITCIGFRGLTRLGPLTVETTCHSLRTVVKSMHDLLTYAVRLTMKL